MREIGSFIEYKKEFFGGKADKFFNGAIFFKSGRAAMSFLLSYFKIKTLYAPSYFCGEVVDYLKKIKGLSVKKYQLDDNFQIKPAAISREKIKDKATAAFLLVDLFGKRDKSHNKIKKYLLKTGVKFFIDRSHSILNAYDDSKAVSFGSIRKTLINLPGAYVLGVKYSGKFARFNINKNLKFLKIKEKYLRNSDKNLKKKFLEYFRKEEDKLNVFNSKNPPISCPALMNLLKSCIFLKMSRQRRVNYYYLAKHIKKNKKFKVVRFPYANKETPTHLIIKCVNQKTRDKLKQYMIANDIYATTHWPNGTRLSKLVISVPIDHRYGAKDMAYISQTMNALINKL